MLDKVTALSFKEMIIYGVRNLDNHCSIVNNLNVFPVPDGDTGTNMVMTLKNGIHVLENADGDLSDVAERFANATVFGARGNSGVIVSQFFKGMSQGLKGVAQADCRTLIDAIYSGCQSAYRAVANPTEGTILTVLREATKSASDCLNSSTTVDDLISSFIDAAKLSLENTPNLLPVLQKAGVVDSGGAGIIYFFEGVQKYLRGEEIESVKSVAVSDYIDYSKFNKNSSFEYGYCTELLIQITVESFDYNSFVSEISQKGDSLVTSFEDYKVKVHIHTKTPEVILAYCHRFGEFLSLKIENMSVQHTQNAPKILCSENSEEGNFSVVAVAHNEFIQNMLVKMGADIVLLSKDAPSSKDFIEAFDLALNHKILVFPNSSNSIMSAEQAAGLYQKGEVIVINSRSVSDCYSSLAIIDYGDDVYTAKEQIQRTIDNIYTVVIARAVKDVVFGDVEVNKNDYFSLAGKDIISAADCILTVVKQTVSRVMKEKDASVVNLFYGKSISDEAVAHIIDELDHFGLDVEFVTIPTQDETIDIAISFE